MKLLKFTGSLLVLCFLSATGCGSKSKDGFGFSFFSKSDMEAHYPDFEEKILSDSLKAVFSGKSSIDVFYRNNQYAPLWAKDVFDFPALDSLVFYLGNSGMHGLNPERFRYSDIKRLVDTLRAGGLEKDMSMLYHHLVRLEKLATKAFIDYNTGLRFGFMNPQKDFSGSYHIPVQEPDSVYYGKLFSELQNDPGKFLRESQPNDPGYLKMQKALSFYKEKESITFTSIPKKEKTSYKLKDVNSKVFPLIAKRLMITGELSETANPDSVYSSLTADLLVAVNLFRKQMSYPEDPEIGDPTIDALNRPLSYYREKITVNLERLRWKRKTAVGDKFVEVNVAAFMLKAIEPNQTPLLMNVCVGKAGENQTPLLQSEIYYINLNPKWSVPSSIVEKEIYWSVKKNPDYLKRNQMKLIDKDGKEVSQESLDWNTLNPKKFPYLIRQDAGAGNSLGRIKFMFNNRFSVYLHDTPAKKAFSYRNRAISHGCVRVQKPIELSYFLLEEKDPVFLDRILITIDKTPESQEGKNLLKKGGLRKLGDVVNLSQKIPLVIDYYTSYVLPDGNVYFADDVYGFDKKIINVIK